MFGADDRTLFRSPLLFLLLFLTYNLTHSDYVLLAIADGVANSRFIGCFVTLFFLQVLISIYNATSHTKTNADDRTLFRSPLLFLLPFLTYNLTHSDFVLLAIADGVANSRFIGCFVALFFLQVLPHATMRLPILKQMRTTGRCRFP